MAGAGGAVLVTATSPARAADGDEVLLGRQNEAESTTTIEIDAETGESRSTLTLTNTVGPALSLTPVTEPWAGELRTGEILSRASGPLVGVEVEGRSVTTPLLTEQNVWLPFVLDTPIRLVDTRTSQGRLRITRPSPLAPDGRLPARRPMTFWIAPVGAGFAIPGVHVNLTIVTPSAPGWASVYPGPTRPSTSTVNFVKNDIVANSTLIGTSTGSYSIVVDPREPAQQIQASVISVYCTAAAWIVVDATAAYATGGVPPVNQEQARRSSAGSSPTERAVRAMNGAR